MDLLGAEYVMAGSDWSIVDDAPIREPLRDAMARAGLSADEQDAVAEGNCLRLQGVAPTRTALRAARA